MIKVREKSREEKAELPLRQQNPNASKDHLDHLMKDKNKTVASIARKKLKDMK